MDEVVEEVVQDEPGAAPEETVEVTEEEKKQDEDIKDRARRMGWKDKDSFDREPSNFVDHKIFLKRAEEDLPVMKERLRYMEKQLESQQNTASKMAHIAAERVVAAEKRAYEKAVQEITQKAMVAEQAQDITAYKQHLMDLIDLEKNKPEDLPIEQQQQEYDPVLVKWAQDPANRWFHEDPAMTTTATIYYDNLTAASPYMSVEEKVKHTEQYVKRIHPDKFGSPKERPSTNMVESGNAAAIRKGGKSWNDIPSNDRNTMEKMVRSASFYGKKDKDSITKMDQYKRDCITTYFNEQK